MAQASDEHQTDHSRPTKPRRIVLAGWPSRSFEKIVSLLHSINPTALDGRENGGINPFTERLVVPKDPANVDFIQSQVGYDESFRVLIFIETLESVLARSLADGQPAMETARQWVTIVEPLLAMCRADRSRVRIIATDDAIHAPACFAEYLSETLGWPLSYANDLNVDAKHRWDDFYLMVATQYVREQFDLNEFAQELDISRDFHPARRPRIEVDWSAVLSDVETVRRENCVLVELLHKLQMDLEHNVLQLKAQEDSTRDMSRKLAESEARQNESIQKIVGLERRLANRTRALENMMKSTSWKITKPLRSTMELLKRVIGR